MCARNQPGSLQKQCMLLTAEPSLHSQTLFNLVPQEYLASCVSRVNYMLLLSIFVSKIFGLFVFWGSYSDSGCGSAPAGKDEECERL